MASSRSEPRFVGRTALVTGAGSGIGRATVLRLASEGARVVGLDVDAGAIGETAALVAELDGAPDLLALTGDVSVKDDCEFAVGATVDRFGGLDVLANVAGIVRMRHFADVTEEEWRRVFGVNVDGVFFLSQAAIPHLLLAEGGGRIVNVVSNAGLMGQAYSSSYCASKGAVVQLTRALATEFVKQPLRVNAVAPGGVDTPLSKGVRFPDGVDWDLVQKFVSERGMGTPDDVATAIAFLASDDALLANGTILSIDQGLVAG